MSPGFHTIVRSCGSQSITEHIEPFIVDSRILRQQIVCLPGGGCFGARRLFVFVFYGESVSMQCVFARVFCEKYLAKSWTKVYFRFDFVRTRFTLFMF
jgi:hypothetical protein